MGLKLIFISIGILTLCCILCGPPEVIGRRYRLDDLDQNKHTLFFKSGETFSIEGFLYTDEEDWYLENLKDLEVNKSLRVYNLLEDNSSYKLRDLDENNKVGFYFEFQFRVSGILRYFTNEELKFVLRNKKTRKVKNFKSIKMKLLPSGYTNEL